MMKNNNNNGFTLIEVLITILIVSIFVSGLTILTITIKEYMARNWIIRTIDQYSNDSLELLSHKLINCDSLLIRKQTEFFDKIFIYSTDFNTQDFKREIVQCNFNQGIKINNELILNTDIQKIISKNIIDNVKFDAFNAILISNNEIKLLLTIEYYRKDNLIYRNSYISKTYLKNIGL